ncbi:hypothetical protein ABZ477_06310 [Microbacterium sp. NPDC019599]|uniref:hypothetical protein n=1 Tax=Microbacterium sp. NPDC019599 TaxID=3154690 RepID=UPI0033D57E1A
MSTTGNEYEKPGVNYPDREDADGATDTPREGEDTRAGRPGMEGQPQDAAAAAQSGAAEDGEGGAMPPPRDAQPPRDSQPASDAQPARDTASHQAVGIGVIDDGSGASQDADDAQGGGTSQPQGPGSSTEAQPGSHYGQDGGRDTLTASAAQKEGALGPEQEQRLPAMAQNNATEVDKIAGIVAQTRQDLAATETTERVAEVLKQRFEQSAIDLPDDEIMELARQITTGDA